MPQMAARLGSVPYLNARPLVWAFESGALEGAAVRYEVPSRLPALLDSGECDAILVSSVEAFRRPGARCAAGVGIASEGPVHSVRLFSQTDFSKIKSIALDESSMTSSLLAQVVLAESFNVRPECGQEPPSLPAMLARHDACVLIGDPCLEADDAGLLALDLGEAWRELTGLPFVWALWVGEEGLSTALAGQLARAAELGRGETGRLAPPGRAEYLEGFDYLLGDRALAGLEEFRRRLVAHRLCPGACRPEWVRAAALA